MSKIYSRSFNPASFSRLEARTISAHDFSFSQEEHGFGYGLSKPTPPVKKKRHN